MGGGRGGTDEGNGSGGGVELDEGGKGGLDGGSRGEEGRMEGREVGEESQTERRGGDVWRTFNSGGGRVVRRVLKRRGSRLFVLLADSPRCRSWCFPCPFGWKSFNYVSRSFATVLVGARVLSFTGGGGGGCS